MRNHYDMKMTRPQLNPSQMSSISTAMAKKRLKNRFRISEPQNEKRRKESDGREHAGCPGGKSGIKQKVLRDRSSLMTSSNAEEDGKDKKSNITKTRANATIRDWNGPITVMPVLKRGSSADRMDPFDIVPISGAPEVDVLFRLCTYPADTRSSTKKATSKASQALADTEDR